MVPDRQTKSRKIPTRHILPLLFAPRYFNTEAVQAAIGAIPTGAAKVAWSGCSDHVGQNYNGTDVNLPMMPVWKKLVAVTPALKLMIYSGDDDSVCATMGTQQFIWDLGQLLIERQS